MTTGRAALLDILSSHSPYSGLPNLAGLVNTRSPARGAKVVVTRPGRGPLRHPLFIACITHAY